VLNPKVRYLEQCSRPTLIKMGMEGSPEMAILPTAGSENSYWQAIVLSTCELLTLSDEHALLPEFDDAPVLDFGAIFSIEPEYGGYCVFGGGSLFRVPGTLIRCSDDTYDLVISRKNSESFGYLSLPSMQVRPSERGGAQVAFASWSIWLSGHDKPHFIRP
jgi:hypothetical protein